MKRYVPLFPLSENEVGTKTIQNRLATRKKKPIPPKTSDELWTKAESIAKANGQEGNYAYIMGIFKKMTGYKKKRKPAKRR